MYTIKCTYIHINICSFQEHNLDLNKCQNVNLPSKHGILRLHFPIPKLTTYSDQDPSFYACHHVTPSVHINSLYDCSNIFSRWLNLICSTKNIEQLTVDYWVVYSRLWNFMEQSQYETDLCPFHCFIGIIDQNTFSPIYDLILSACIKANIWLFRAK